MAQYIGFSTINAGKPRSAHMTPGKAGGVGSVVQPVIYGKKFRLVDDKLVIQDLINAFNISQGQVVGNPGYGTTLWSFAFDPNTSETQQAIVDEVRRIVHADPRILLNAVNVYTQEHGILVEMEIAVQPNQQAQLLNLFFNSTTRQAVVQ